MDLKVPDPGSGGSGGPSRTPPGRGPGEGPGEGPGGGSGGPPERGPGRVRKGVPGGYPGGYPRKPRKVPKSAEKCTFPPETPGNPREPLSGPRKPRKVPSGGGVGGTPLYKRLVVFLTFAPHKKMYGQRWKKRVSRLNAPLTRFPLEAIFRKIESLVALFLLGD